LACWWVALHALLAATALLVAWPWPAAAGALAAVVGHTWWRWPRRPPGVIVIGADASCAVPEHGIGPLALSPRTRIAPWWVRLDAREGRRRLDILLLADQLDPDDWRRLAAIVRRATVT
jgi:hypothetical protein